MMMDEFLCNLITTSSAGGGGNRAVLKSPAKSASETLVSMPTSTGFLGKTSSQIVQPSSQQAPRPFPNAMSRAPTGNNSVLTTDMSHMIAWLTQNNQSQASGSSIGGNSQYPSQYESETNRIPKPYNGMSSKDCASVVAQSIRSIIKHTCNDDFRHQCFEKLGVSTSRDAELELRRRLNDMLLQPPQDAPSIGGASSRSESMDVDAEEQQSNSSLIPLQ